MLHGDATITKLGQSSI